MAASKIDTRAFGGAAYSTAAPENNFDFDAICACTSRPTTEFHLVLGEFLVQKIFLSCSANDCMKRLLFRFRIGCGKVSVNHEIDGLLHQFHFSVTIELHTHLIKKKIRK